MSLGDLQTALGTMVAAHGTERQSEERAFLCGLNLDEAERLWLDELKDSAGFAVTCYIGRWWRETRLRWAVQLTLSVLGSERSAFVINEYLKTIPGTSLFFMPEALGFLDFVIASALEIDHLPAIARFERALLIASSTDSFSTDEMPDDAQLSYIEQHPAAALLEFDAPPEELLGALLTEQPLPAAHGQKIKVLIAPGLSQWWRPATSDEARILARCQSPIALEDLLSLETRQSLRELLNIGALHIRQERALSSKTFSQT